MILIISPNLCLDRVVIVRDLRAGAVHRADAAAISAGGKGLNVARVVRVLGEAPRVVGVVGNDAPGGALIRDARVQRLGLQAVRVNGATRTCTLLVDPGRGETVINEPGPPVPRAAATRLRALAREAAPRAKVIVLTGSLPPGLPEGFYAEVARSVERTRRVVPEAHRVKVPLAAHRVRVFPDAHRARVILDASGGALRAGLAARPYLVKINREELAGLMARRLTSLRAVGRAAADVREAGAGAVLVTLGEQGALLVAGGRQWRLTPPRVRRVNAIGAGDSLTGAIAVGLVREYSLLDAARLGMAAAAADVTTLLPGTVDAARVARLSRRVAAHSYSVNTSSTC